MKQNSGIVREEAARPEWAGLSANKSEGASRVGARQSGALKNAFTVDVEDYFQVAAFSSVISPDEWNSAECRVEKNIEHLLELLARHNANGTFFILGWIAQRYPNLVRQIAQSGHEIASHGYAHKKATEQAPAELAEDVLKSRLLLEDLTGQQVIGYRAPSFSVNHTNPWFHGVLNRAGYLYSSSVYPIRHDHYGMPDASRFAYQADGGITELPATAVRVAGNNLPAAGGGYFRLMPYVWSRWCIERVNNSDGESAIFYCHPWEVDPDQPRIHQAAWKARFRHYVNLHKTSGRIERLLSDFKWDRVDRVFGTKIAMGTGR